MALARAAERRRQGAGDLIEATGVVAKAIRQQLRNGDEVVVGRWLAEARTASPVSGLSDLRGVEDIDPGLFGSGRFSRRVALSGGGPSYRASAARLSDGTRRDVLTRDAAVLDAEVRGHWTDDRGGDLHSATADE